MLKRKSILLQRYIYIDLFEKNLIVNLFLYSLLHLITQCELKICEKSSCLRKIELRLQSTEFPLESNKAKCLLYSESMEQAKLQLLRCSQVKSSRQVVKRTSQGIPFKLNSVKRDKILAIVRNSMHCLKI